MQKKKTLIPKKDVAEARVLLHKVRTLCAQILAEETRLTSRWQYLHPTYKVGARNLMHYISLRHYDIRPPARATGSAGAILPGPL